MFISDSYIRRCQHCSNFFNWRVLPGGTAICGDCGTEHQPKEYHDPNDEKKVGENVHCKRK